MRTAELDTCLTAHISFKLFYFLKLKYEMLRDLLLVRVCTGRTCYEISYWLVWKNYLVHGLHRRVASLCTSTGFIRGILRGVRYAKSLRVLFLHRRSPSLTTLVLYSRVVFIFNEPTRDVTRPLIGQSTYRWEMLQDLLLVWR